MQWLPAWLLHTLAVTRALRLALSMRKQEDGLQGPLLVGHGSAKASATSVTSAFVVAGPDVRF